MLRPTRALSAAVVAAATAARADWAAVGLVNPGIVNVIAVPDAGIPADIVTVKTCPERAAAPAAPELGAVKTTFTVPERAKPDPAIVMTILPVDATADSGVRETVMVTPVAPFAWLLRVMAVPSEPAST